MICPKCHTVNDDGEKFCRNCGFQLNSARICPECGKTNDSNSKYCKECGTVLTPVNTFRKQIIEENTKKSFFSMYKVPIICALVIILAIGAVTGMAYYNGNSGGDDGSNSIIPLDNNYTGFFGDDSTQAQMQNDTNETNETLNETNDTNKSNTLTEKVENKTNKTSQADKVNKTNKTKTLNDTVNKTKPSNNSSKVNSSSSKNNSSKTITEKVNKTDKSDKDKDKKNKIGSSDENDSESSMIIPGISDNDSDDNKSSSIIDELVNDSDNDSETYSENVSDSDNDTLEDDTLNSSDLTEIEMEDVPNLAMKVSERNYKFSTIDYNDYEFSEAQCIDIFSQYLLNVDKGKTSSIEIRDVKDAPNSSGEDLSQSIEKDDYLSIAKRVHSWIDTKDTVPNYVGISTVGADDLSDEKMLKLFTLAILEYSVTGDLPESVDI